MTPPRITGLTAVAGPMIFVTTYTLSWIRFRLSDHQRANGYSNLAATSEQGVWAGLQRLSEDLKRYGQPILCPSAQTLGQLRRCMLLTASEGAGK